MVSMKTLRYTYLLLMAFAIVFCFISCSDDGVDPIQSNPTPDAEGNYGWSRYVGKHLTSDSDIFVWHTSNDLAGDLYNNRPITPGEFVEFGNLTESGVTMRYGNEQLYTYNLAHATDNKINHVVACPYSAMGASQYVDIQVSLTYPKGVSYCKLVGLIVDPYGFRCDIEGKINGDLEISKSFSYIDPFPRLRLETIPESTDYRILVELRPIQPEFDAVSLKSVDSPILLQWQSEQWTGEAAAIIPDPSDFLQLLFNIPILKYSDYWKSKYSNQDPEYVSITHLLSTLFPGAYQRSVREYDHHFNATWNFNPDPMTLGPFDTVVWVSRIDDANMCVMLDACEMEKLFSLTEGKVLGANILRSLLTEELCYFEMKYELTDTDVNDSSREREFKMTLKDPQLSRNLMKYLFITLLMKNREAIKDYIRQDSALSLHAETLCTAVDRLEDIYAGTTDLTLGYKLTECQWKDGNMWPQKLTR